MESTHFDTTPYRRRFCVDDWEKMVSTGALPEFEGLELINGDLLRKEPAEEMALTPLPLRTACVRRLNRLFSLRLGDSALVDVRAPVALHDQKSEPHPDAVLLRPREDFYSAGTPKSSDVLLILEVMNPAVTEYLDFKLSLYAKAYISEAWKVDLNSEEIWVYRRPSPKGYRDVRSCRRGESISPEAFPETAFAVDEILG